MAGNGSIGHRELLEAIFEVRDQMADLRVVVAGLPTKEDLRGVEDSYRKADSEIRSEMRKKQVVWGASGFAAALAAIAGALGIKQG